MSSETDAPRRSRWTLARRLSLLFVILLTLVVGAFGASAYVGVREAATERSSQRLSSVALELAAGVSRGVVSRGNAMRVLANDSTIVRALSAVAMLQDGTAESTPDDVGTRAVDVATGSQHREALATMFARRRSATDTTLLGWHVVAANGTQVYGPPLDPRDSLELASIITTAVQTDSVAHSALYESEGQIRILVAAPVTVGGKVIGAIASMRVVVGSETIDDMVKRLSGQNATVAYASRGSDVWSSVQGERIPPTLDQRTLSELPDSVAARVEVAPGDVRYVASASVKGAPLSIVFTESEDSILARPRAMLRQLFLMALTVLVLGTIGAWWLSRLETRPLTELRAAADAIASGDYTRIVTPSGAEETAALADAFNTMSMRISGAHATLAAQNEELLRANEAKARFLAVMSHELRTPLNAIGGYSELIALGVHGPTTDAQQQALERIGRSKDQLLHLVSDILNYARLEATPLRVSREWVSVQTQFDSVRETVAEQFERKGVQLVIAPTEARVCADPVRVQQILINLVTNALQFTAAGGRVDIYAETSHGMTSLIVRDTGVGIKPEEQKTIFEAFVQVDNSLTRRAGGAGLGLAIVRQLATAMEGAVHMESVYGVGSTFAVSLPGDKDAPSQRSTRPPALASASS